MKMFAAFLILAVSLAFAGCDDDARYGRNYGPPQAGAPPIGYGYDFGDVRQMGHRDGIQAAYRDMNDRRSPDPRRHGEYRRPPVDGRARDAYRAAFEDGYQDAFRRGHDRRDYDDRR